MHGWKFSSDLRAQNIAKSGPKCKEGQINWATPKVKYNPRGAFIRQVRSTRKNVRMRLMPMPASVYHPPVVLPNGSGEVLHD